MNFEKVTAIINWPIPKNFHDVQIFLNFTNYYRRFMESYARKTKPIIDLLMKIRNGRKINKFN
jgi:hypothetical protein